MKRKVVAVSDVNRYVNHLLQEDYMLGDLWVQGEVSNCKYHHSGHIYMTLKDEKASIQAVMFSKDAVALNFQIKEGMELFARVRIALYEKTGSYQAYISEIEAKGKGTLYEHYEQLKEKLLKEGLFDQTYKKDIPKFPQKVGVVTSITGAAIKDILNVAKRRYPGIPIYIYPASVQGVQAKTDIVKAIETANKEALVDVLLVGRGGGSIEDLWSFNEEEVARAIFASVIPIVSCVGHEVDFTIADFVSDLRAPTPSAGAEMVFPSSTEYEERLMNLKGRLNYSLKQRLSGYKRQLEEMLTRPVFEHKYKYFQDLMLEVDAKQEQLQKTYTKNLTYSQMRFTDKINQLEKLSPLGTIKRGYSVVQTEEGQIVRSVADVKEGDFIDIMVSDGSIRGKVYEKG